MLARASRKLIARFCANQTVQQTNTSSSVIEPPKTSEVPVYLRPYDKSKYETPLQKIKLNSGKVDTSQVMPSLMCSPSREQRS